MCVCVEGGKEGGKSGREGGREQDLLEPIRKMHGDTQAEIEGTADKNVIAALLRRRHVQIQKFEAARRCPLNVS